MHSLDAALTGDVILEDMHDVLKDNPGSILAYIPRQANSAAHTLVQTFYVTEIRLLMFLPL